MAGPNRHNWATTHDDGVGWPGIHESPDVFDDDYAEEDPFVTNGFAHRRDLEPPIPTHMQVIQSTVPPAPRRSYSSGGSGLEFEQHGDGQNNGANGEHMPRDPFASPDDDSSSLQRTPSGYSHATISDTPTLQNRSLSHSSSFSVAGSQSDFQGITGPSHPYAMYSQGVNVGRTPSVATTSTLHAPSRASSGTQGSTYGYRTYAQNILTDPDDRRWQGTRARMPMQMGVHGRRQPYHRRIGPDGEEQDIIGPDGHAEQLPPYSRYPDEDEEASKPSLPISATAAIAIDVPSEDAPEPASQQPLLPADAHLGPRAPPEEPPVVRNASSLGTTETMSSGDSEKPKWGGRSRKQRRRNKRFWLTVFGAMMVIILAVIVGGVIGGLLVRNQQAAESLNATPVATETVTTSLYDASIIATPPAATSLPTGSFQLPLKPVNDETRRGCLSDEQQEDSWTCSLPGRPLDFTLSYNPYSSASSISISGGPQIPSPITCGSQPPTIAVVDLDFVTDLDSQGMGPALYFQTTYDKIVVVGADEIPAPPETKRLSRRQSDPLAAGDRPWFCFWNQTFIQGYVYLGRDIPASVDSTSTSTSTSSASSTVTPFVLTPSLAISGPATLPLFSSTAKPPSPSASRRPYQGDNSASYANPSAPDSPPFDHPARAAASRNYGSYVPNRRPVPPHYRKLLANKVAITYPLIVKLEERRLPGNTAPYCQQMKILEHGGFNPALDDDGDPVGIVTLHETFPPLEAESDSDDSVRKVRRDEPPEECHCQWVSA